jgi:CheY-like chemotaxis protein
MLILRVGNSPFILDTVGATLRKNGISSECAVSGREALEFLRLYDYDLVLMDHQLADVPAHEVVRMIRAASLKVPVAILSGDATVQAKVRALDQRGRFPQQPLRRSRAARARPGDCPAQPGPCQFDTQPRPRRAAAGSP